MVSVVKSIREVLDVHRIFTAGVDDEYVLDIHDDYRPTVASPPLDVKLYYAATDRFGATLPQSIRKNPRVLILKMRHVSLIDVTGVENLSMLIDSFIKKNGIVIISELSEEPMKVIRQSELYDMIGEEHFFSDTTDAINYALNVIDVSNCPYCGKKGKDTCQVFKEVAVDSNER